MRTLQIIRLDTQPDQRVDGPTLTRWERDTGYTLPKDYRTFLLKYNGGVVRPWKFRHDHPEVHEDYRESTLDYLHEWERVLHDSHLDTPPDLVTRPPGHIHIGHDPGNGRILLSLLPESHGNVVYWVPLHMLWGEEPNNVVGWIAPSFTAFLDSLYDDGETENFHWDVLARKRAPVPLIL